ncbi:MAG: hypothetical protein U9R43_03510, partial [Thermodesulfobacteriota bacterium]|nr:hypothetical protein [Thermodesulfobacteriota bacterium]
LAFLAKISVISMFYSLLCLGLAQKLLHISGAYASHLAALRKLGIYRIFLKFSSLARLAPEHLKLRTYFRANP